MDKSITESIRELIERAQIEGDYHLVQRLSRMLEEVRR